MSRPTLSHIAEQLGVSTATVSLAMRGSPKISQKTRERVSVALKETGYIYQRSAAGLRTAKTHTVGVILNDISDPFCSTLLATIEEELSKAGRTVFLCNSNESVERQTEFLRVMAEYNADGVIVSPAIGSTPGDFLDCTGSSLPMVFVSRAMFELDVDHVVGDDRQAALLAARRLLKIGHRRIAFVGGDPSVSCFASRLQGYKEALGEASITFDEALVRACIPKRSAGFAAARWVAGLDPRPTAAICYNDTVALGFCSGLQGEGLFPGTNFALIGHEDIEEGEFVNPPLSTTAVSGREMGRMAAAILVERAAKPDAPPQRLVLPSELVVRESCTISDDVLHSGNAA
ncbi:MAG: LacI family DNA-binding transcriptional regulator [Rhodospirillaceae bacterium]|nr:LacI family DNA-binding transcriptional regulator [Rhodospirillaceae bacterium]